MKAQKGDRIRILKSSNYTFAPCEAIDKSLGAVGAVVWFSLKAP